MVTVRKYEFGIDHDNKNSKKTVTVSEISTYDKFHTILLENEVTETGYTSTFTCELCDVLVCTYEFENFNYVMTKYYYREDGTLSQKNVEKGIAPPNSDRIGAPGVDDYPSTACMTPTDGVPRQSTAA